MFKVSVDRFIYELSLPETVYGYKDFNWYSDSDYIYLYLTNSNYVTYHCIITKSNIPSHILEKLSLKTSIFGLHDFNVKNDISALKSEISKLHIQKG